MIDLLKWILRYLAPHAEGDPGEGADDDTGDDGDDAGDDADDTGAGDNTGADDAGAQAAAKPDAAAARLEAAERAAREAQESVQALQRQAQTRPDPTADEEERKLRDPATTDLEKWQIQSNRALRQSQHQSAQALFQAQDMADKTTYTVKAASNPLYTKYEAKVEAELAKARANGANVPRETILQVLVGRDMLAGNFKPAKGKVAAKEIPRGRSPGARSDTPARGSLIEAQKREARLSNQII